MTDVRVVSEPLRGSPLSLAAQAGDVPDSWYPPRPSSVDEWVARARQVQERFATGDWLASLAPAFGAAGAAASRLERVAATGGIVVTTGQQPGLFGGPVYTWSKAFSALALADALEARTGIATAPVFWAATDDADFAEARWTKVVVEGEIVRLELHDEPLPGTPMSAAPLGQLDGELRELERASGSAAFPRPLHAAREAYGRGGMVGGAFLALLRALLEPAGVAVLDASDAAVRRQGAAVLREALRRAPDLAGALRARAAELRAAGFEPQVGDVDDLSLVFRLEGGIKRRIPLRDAQRAASNAPETLAPNVLLRPVLERAMLPTAAYCAGPAELSYFAQVTAVADALGVDRPLPVPRWSGTIIEPHVARILERLGVDYTDLREPHALEGALARAAVPRDVSRSLTRIRETIDKVAVELSADAAAATMVPPAAIAGARTSILDRLRRLERRYVAAAKRREEDLMRQVATARAHLYPDGERQERALNLLPMLARNGPPLVAAMKRATDEYADRLVGAAVRTVTQGGEATRHGGYKA